MKKLNLVEFLRRRYISLAFPSSCNTRKQFQWLQTTVISACEESSAISRSRPKKKKTLTLHCPTGSVLEPGPLSGNITWSYTVTSAVDTHLFIKITGENSSSLKHSLIIVLLQLWTARKLLYLQAPRLVWSSRSVSCLTYMRVRNQVFPGMEHLLSAIRPVNRIATLRPKYFVQCHVNLRPIC